jgi:hypothetical protein
MALAAAQVVDALAALVVPQLTADRVKTSRTWPWTEAELPAARVFITAEPIERVTLGAAINAHTLNVDVQYTARATADLDDTLNALAAAGKALLFAGTPPYGLEITGIDRQLATEGESAVGQITLQLQCLFHAAPSAPETIL